VLASTLASTSTSINAGWLMTVPWPQFTLLLTAAQSACSQVTQLLPLQSLLRPLENDTVSSAEALMQTAAALPEGCHPGPVCAGGCAADSCC